MPCWSHVQQALQAGGRARSRRGIRRAQELASPDLKWTPITSVCTRLHSPQWAELDAKFACGDDLIKMADELVIARAINERIRLGRLNQCWWIKEGAERTPDKTYLWFEGQTWSYSQLEVVVDRVAAWLQAQGVGAGDAVNLILSNTPAFVFQLLALHKVVWS
jgi:non-ribosomal peptide synthetase component F